MGKSTATKPVYVNPSVDETAKLETRVYEIVLRVELADVPLSEDDDTITIREEIDRPLERLLSSWHTVNRAVTADLMDSWRTTDLERGEHIPTLEHVLDYLDMNHGFNARIFASKASGAFMKRVVGNRIY